MKVYDVVHKFTVPGCYGPIDKEELVRSFEDKDDAERFFKHFNNPHRYYFDDRYNFECGGLEIREKTVLAKWEDWGDDGKITALLENPEDR